MWLLSSIPSSAASELLGVCVSSGRHELWLGLPRSLETPPPHQYSLPTCRKAEVGQTRETDHLTLVPYTHWQCDLLHSTEFKSILGLQVLRGSWAKRTGSRLRGGHLNLREMCRIFYTHKRSYDSHGPFDKLS